MLSLFLSHTHKHVPQVFCIYIINMKCSDIKKISTPNAIIQTLTNLICKNVTYSASLYEKIKGGAAGTLVACYGPVSFAK